MKAKRGGVWSRRWQVSGSHGAAAVGLALLVLTLSGAPLSASRCDWVHRVQGITAAAIGPDSHYVFLAGPSEVLVALPNGVSCSHALGGATLHSTLLPAIRHGERTVSALFGPVLAQEICSDLEDLRPRPCPGLRSYFLRQSPVEVVLPHEDVDLIVLERTAAGITAWPAETQRKGDLFTLWRGPDQAVSLCLDEAPASMQQTLEAVFAEVDPSRWATVPRNVYLCRGSSLIVAGAQVAVRTATASSDLPWAESAFSSSPALTGASPGERHRFRLAAAACPDASRPFDLRIWQLVIAATLAERSGQIRFPPASGVFRECL